MTEFDPYKSYQEGALFSTSPMGIVIALYEGAIGAVQQARICLEQKDIWGRGRQISKAVDILTELLASLNPEKAPELCRELTRLYDYMQRRLLEAHSKKSASALEEVERLLNTLLDGWRVVNEKTSRESAAVTEVEPAEFEPVKESHSMSYGDYGYDLADSYSPQLVASF